MKKLYLCVSAAAIAASVASPGMAQVAGGPPPGEVSDQSGASVAEVLVTAQRRSEREQDVPISISVVTAQIAERQGVTGTESLGLAVPALQFSRQTGNGGTPFIRGVGTSDGTGGSESPVAVYVDDVYVGSPAATLFQFNNIEGIEVLKGPQGTLFGRNATGGVVNVHTKKPSQEVALDASVGYGSYGTYYGSLYATGGLSDTVSMNVAVAGKDQSNGYGRNLVTGADTLKGWNDGIRSELLWEPSQATSLLVTGEYSDRKDDAGMSVVIWPGTVATGGGTYKDRYGTYDTPADFSQSKTWDTSAKLNQDFGPVRFVSISAYRNTTLDWQLDGDGSPTGANILGINYTLKDKAFSQELQLLSQQGGSLRWIVGAFFYHTDDDYDPHHLFGTSLAALGGGRNLYTHDTLSSYAGFGELTYEFAKDTDLIVGARYTSDHLSHDQTLITASGVTTIPKPPEESAVFAKPTWRATLDHKFTEDFMAYATYSRGFKSGRFNALAATTGTTYLPSVQPEILDAYEIGIKSEMLDRKLRVNVSGFYYDYSNLQVSIVIPGASIVLNAAEAKIKGADVDFDLVPNRYLDFSGGFEVLDATYSSFPNGPFNIPSPAVCTPTPHTTGTPTGGLTTCPADLAGNQLSRAPKFTASLSGTFTMPTSVGDVSLNAAVYRNAGFFWEPDNNYAQPGYTLLSSTLSWTSPNRKYTVKAYGKNLLNEYYDDYFSTGGLRAAGSPAMPRNFGVEFGLHL